MLINTKHIVMFDDAVNDFNQIAQMVDTGGAVLVIKDGRPAYAVVSFEDVQEADQSDNGTAVNSSEPKAEEPKCACGRHPKSQCHCGGHGQSQSGCGGHHQHGPGEGGHHPHHAPEPEEPHEHRGHGPHARRSAGPQAYRFGFDEHFGHGSEAGHIHHGEDETWSASADAEGEWNGDGEWNFDFHAGPGFDPLFRGGPDFSIEDFVGKVPPELLDAGRRFVNQLSPLFGLFGAAGGSASTERTDEPKKDQES